MIATRFKDLPMPSFHAWAKHQCFDLSGMTSDERERCRKQYDQAVSRKMATITLLTTTSEEEEETACLLERIRDNAEYIVSQTPDDGDWDDMEEIAMTGVDLARDVCELFARRPELFSYVNQ